MQMQPIHPLCQLVAETKETQPSSGEKFIDSLQAVRSKSDSIRNREPDTKTKQEDTLAPATPPEPGEIVDTPQMPAAETSGQVATAGANEEQPPADDEQLTTAAVETTSNLIDSAAPQSQLMIDLPDEQHREEAVLRVSQINTFQLDAVAENPDPKTDEARSQQIVPIQTAINPIAPDVSFKAARQENGRQHTAVTVAEFLPEQEAAPFQQDTKIIQLQVQSELPRPPAQPTALPGQPVTVVADNASIRDQKAASPLTLRFVELLQKTAAGEPEQTAAQAATTADLTFKRFAEIFGRTMVPAAETVPELVPIRQRYPWTPGRVEAMGTGFLGQGTEKGLTVLKIAEQFMTGNTSDGPGKDILWVQQPSIDSATLHTRGAGELADLTATFMNTPDAPANSVIIQDGSAARLPQGIVVAEHQMIDNVIQQVSLRAGHGQSSSISIRLHPEELGHLKMDLVSNNENIKAHIHVQTQLTLDILEKNLHRLREGFAQQGLILDEIQVSVNSDTSSGPGLFDDQRTLQARPHHAKVLRAGESRETVMVETMVAPYRPDGSINLRI